MKTRQLIIIGVGILILAGSFFIMMALESFREDPESNPPEDPVRAVQAQAVEYGDVTIAFEAAGRLGSHQYVDLITEVQGEILQGSVSLKKGETFKKGQLLVRIFDDEAEYNLKASRARFLNLIANALPDFRIDYPDKYDEMLKFFESIDMEKPLPELPEIKSLQVKTFLSSRNILTEYYGIKSAEVRFNKFNLYAPFNGTIIEAYLEVGSIANPGTRIARLISTEKLELEVPVEINDAKWVRIGDEIEVLSEDGTARWQGKVVRKADFVDPATQSVSVFISLSSTKDQPLYEGQYLRAVFSGRVINGAMEVPRNVVFNSNQVFTVNDGKLNKKVIDIHKINNETLVFSGLEEGTILVTEPLVNAREGSLVQINNN